VSSRFKAREPTVRVSHLGVLDYLTAWRWQTATADALREGSGQEALAFVEHPPVYTFGRRVRPKHLLVDIETLNLRGADVIESDRGGDITFHGPGQLVCYPILDLRARGIGPVEYVRGLEETLIGALAAFDIDSERVAGRPGVWAAGAKVAAIGVRVQGGVTTHGFALNVDPELSWFDAIVPCGLADASVTSMAEILGAAPAIHEVQSAVLTAFESVFGGVRELVSVDGR
jgi:lipoyl(octanoyl) transferase